MTRTDRFAVESGGWFVLFAFVAYLAGRRWWRFR